MKKGIFILFNLYIFATCQLAESETYLIPEGFEGKVAIVFAQSKGQPKHYDKLRRIYHIDTTGVVLTQFEGNYGFINRQYFYVDSAGRRKELGDLAYKDRKNLILDEEEVGIYLSFSVAHGNSGTANSIDTQEFVVSSQKSLHQWTTTKYREAFQEKLKRIVGHDF